MPLSLPAFAGFPPDHLEPEKLNRSMLKQSCNLQGDKTCVFAVAVLAFAVGCQAWPFGAKERTSIITPAMRTAAVQEMAARADRADSAEQLRLTDQLAMQIRTEPDPLVRQAIQATIAEFPTPLALDVLIAGLQDDDLDVRLTCCRKLGQRSEPRAIQSLSSALKNDEELDVRLAAVDALGQIHSPESIPALATALNDRDPALQYAGVQALQAISNQDFGNDVEAWRQYAEGENPQIAPNISVAERMKRLSPF